jgi:hypothetical protein
VGEEVGIVREQDDGRGRRHLLERGVEVGAAKAQVRRARDPQPRLAVALRRHGVVLEHRQPGPAQRPGHCGALVVPVVVAEHGRHAERRVQGAQARGHLLRRDAPGAQHGGVDVVPQQGHEVRAGGVHPRDHALHVALARVRPTGVEVGHERDAQAVEAPRPARQAQLLLAH